MAVTHTNVIDVTKLTLSVIHDLLKEMPKIKTSEVGNKKRCNIARPA